MHKGFPFQLKGCEFSLRIKKTPGITNAGMNVEKRESFYTVGEIINWYSQYGKEYEGSSKTLKIELFHPAIPLWGIYPKVTEKLT